MVDELFPRGGGRAAPVTLWRRDLARLADQMSIMIKEHEDPELRFKTATEVAQDFVWNVKCELRREFGRVFDPFVDGHEKSS
jgi:hypothetical protein